MFSTGGSSNCMNRRKTSRGSKIAIKGFTHQRSLGEPHCLLAIRIEESACQHSAPLGALPWGHVLRTNQVSLGVAGEFWVSTQRPSQGVWAWMLTSKTFWATILRYIWKNPHRNYQDPLKFKFVAGRQMLRSYLSITSNFQYYAVLYIRPRRSASEYLCLG